METSAIIRYLRHSVLTGIGKSIIVTLISFSFIPLIIKRIGMDYYGLIMMTLIFSNGVTFIDLGISKSVTLLLGKTKKIEKKNQIVSNALFINLILVLISFIVVLLLVYFDIKVFGNDFNKKEHTNLILIIGFFILFISVINNLLTSILEAYCLMHYVNIGFTLSSTLLYTGIYFASFLSINVEYLISIPLLPLIFNSFLFIIIINKKTDLSLTFPNKKTSKQLIGISLKFLNIGIINSLIIPLNKYLLILLSGNSSSIGIFEIGISIASSANNLLSSLSNPLFGIISGLNDKLKIYRLTKNSTLILLASFILGILTYFFIKDFIANLFDHNNSLIIATSSFILLFGISFAAVAEPAYRALLGTERLKEAFFLKLLIPCINIVFFIILFKEGELLRICYAMSIAFFLSSLAIILYYLKFNNTKNVLYVSENYE